jgi:hypothetical protein
MSRRSTYAIKGGSLKSFLNSVNNFLKKTKIVSTVGRTLAPLTGQYSGLANAGVDYLAKQGYGRRRRTRTRRNFLGVGRVVHQKKKRVTGVRRRRMGAGALRLAGGRLRMTRRY